MLRELYHSFRSVMKPSGDITFLLFSLGVLLAVWKGIEIIARIFGLSFLGAVLAIVAAAILWRVFKLIFSPRKRLP